jgi:hypothetical protein
MKQVLFILLLFISFQGFSQETVKLKEIGLEVMKEDLGQMTLKEAHRACAKLGNRWRLPTIFELKKMYEYKDKIGNLKEKKTEYEFHNVYYSSTFELDDELADSEDGFSFQAYVFNFFDGNYDFESKKIGSYSVRAVRTLFDKSSSKEEVKYKSPWE